MKQRANSASSYDRARGEASASEVAPCSPKRCWLLVAFFLVMMTGCRELGVCTIDEADRKDDGSMKRHVAECHQDDPGNWLVDGTDPKALGLLAITGLLELRRREVKNGKVVRV